MYIYIYMLFHVHLLFSISMGETYGKKAAAEAAICDGRLGSAASRRKSSAFRWIIRSKSCHRPVSRYTRHVLVVMLGDLFGLKLKEKTIPIIKTN